MTRRERREAERRGETPADPPTARPTLPEPAAEAADADPADEARTEALPSRRDLRKGTPPPAAPDGPAPEEPDAEPAHSPLFDLLDATAEPATATLPAATATGPAAGALVPQDAVRRVPDQRRGEDRVLTLRALAALGLLVATPAAAGLLVLVLLGWAIFLGLAGNTAVASLLAALGLAIGILMYLVVRQVSGTDPRPLVGAELAPAEHPELWAAATDLATRTGITPPSRMVVDGGVSAGLSTFGHRREAVIGLPLLVGLDRDELRAMLGHEFAHAAPNRLAAVSLAVRVATRLEATTASLERGLARRALELGARPFLAIARPALADHELAADDTAARLCGPGVTASALHRTAKLRTAWVVLTEEYLPLGGPARRRPSLADGLRNVLAARAGSLEAADRPPSSPFDQHLPLRDRIGRLSASAGERRTRGAPAFTLLGDGERSLAQLERSVLVDDDPVADWPQIAALAALADQERVAAALVRAGLAAELPEPVTLGVVLDALTVGEGRRIVDPLLRPGLRDGERPAAAVAVIRDCLAAFVAVALLRARKARFTLDWTGPSRLERRTADGWIAWDGGPHVAAAAASAARVRELRAWLLRIGADLETAVDAAPEPPPRPLSAFADADLQGPFGDRPVDLMLWTSGLLLAPAPAPSATARFRARLAGGSQRAAADRVVRLGEQVGTAPEAAAEAVPGGWWIPADTIRTAQLKDRRVGFELHLRLQDGSGAMVRATPDTQLRGTPLEDLRRLLGDRLSTLA